jgi:hypothetical protein
VSLAAALLVAGCLGDSTGPTHLQVARLAVSPVFATRSALLVSFNRVRITLSREAGTALDTVVTFPSGADSVVLTLLVPITGSSETLTLNLAMINAAGDTVFRGGPVPVVATTGVISGGGAVNVAVRYVGVGADAAGVRIDTHTASVFFRDSVQLAATALDSSGEPIPGTPIVWRSLDPGRATVPADSTGKVIGGIVRGVARIEAALLTNQADTALVTVQPLPAALNLVSGGGQTGPVGGVLALPVVARVLAADSLGVSGVYVHFAATTGGGAPSADSVLTDSLGLAQVQWTLGLTAGPQTLQATVPGVAGATVTFAATAVASTPKTLAFIASPTPAIAGAPIAPAVVVSALDSLGNTATGFTGNVTVAITSGTGRTGATLRGTKTVAAVAGTATFDDLSIDSASTGYTLTASTTGLPDATSAAFAIAPGPPAALTFALQPPASAIYQAPFAIVVAAKDSIGNLAPGFTGTVTVGIGTNPAGGTLGGTVAQTATGSVATFSDLSLDNIGSGYTLVVTSSGLSSATSSAVNIVAPPGWNAWVNTAGGSWSVASNWSKGTVPATTDSVAIKQSGTYTVTLAANAACARLDVGAPRGAQTLDLVRFSMTVAGDFQTLGTGVLRMTSPTAGLTVGGNVTFGGGSTAGLLMSGLITLGGNFIQTGTGPVFAPSGTHRVTFARSVAGTQTIKFSDPVGSFFWDLMLNRPSRDTVRLLSDAQVRDSAIVTGSSVLASTGLEALRLPATGVVRIPNTTPLLRPSRVEFGTLQVDSPFTGGVTVSPDTAVFLNGGSITSSSPGYAWKSVRLAGGTLTSSGTTLNGNLIISAGTYTPPISGAIDSVGGFFRTEGSGVLVMPVGTVPPTLSIRDSAVFAGGSEAGQLVSGTLRLNGDFVQRGPVTTSFQASAAHQTRFEGSGNQTITFANPGMALSTFNLLFLGRASGGVAQPMHITLGSPVFVAGTIADTSVGAADSIVGNGNTLTTAGFNLFNTVFSNAPVVVTSSSTQTLAGSLVTFASMSPTAIQLTMSRGAGTFTISGVAFLVAPTGAGRYFSVANTATAGPNTFNFASPVQPPQSSPPSTGQYTKSGAPTPTVLWGSVTLP